MTRLEAQPVVLIVDDEDLFRCSASEVLQTACPHYTVLQAANGREALDQIEAGPVDVIITDIAMPVMDGLELLLILRNQGSRRPVIVVTAFGNPRIENEIALYGSFSYVEKPVDLPDLIKMIRVAAEGQRSHIEGITLAGFVQLLALERKTCKLRVSKDGQVGELMFRDGSLVDARRDRRSGDGAALEILSWEDGASLDLHTGMSPRRKTIRAPLNHLLLEAMRLKDEGAEEAPVVDASSPAEPKRERLEVRVAVSLEECMHIAGAIGVALMDHVTGERLGKVGGGEQLDIDIASVGNTAVVRSKLKVVQDLGLDTPIEDILITLEDQYHLIRVLTAAPDLFLYLALERDQANLAAARRQLTIIERNLLL